MSKLHSETLRDLAPYEQELVRMVAFLELADGFALAFAECNIAALRGRLLEELQRRCATRSIELAEIDFAELPAFRSPVDALVACAPEPDAGPPSAKHACMAYGLETHLELTDPAPDSLVALNLARDILPKKLAYPVIIWLPNYHLTTLAQVAPDLWAWRSAVFSFTVSDGPSPDTLGPEVFTTAAGPLPEAPYPARVEFLEGLLQEYLPRGPESSARNVPAALDILGELSRAYLAQGQSGRALQYSRMMADLAEQSGDRRQWGVALGNLGLAHFWLGEARRAIEYHEQALVISREVGDRRSEGADLGNLGLAYADLGDARKAIDYYQKHLVIAREIGDRRGEGRALGNLGNAYAALGEARKAIEYHEQALAVSRETGDRHAQGSVLGNVGNAYAALGDTREAIEYYKEQLVLVREIGDRQGECAALANLANQRRELGDFGEARRCLEDGLRLSLSAADPLRTTQLAWVLARVHADADDPATAVALEAFAFTRFAAMEYPQADAAEQKLMHYREQMGESSFNEALAQAEEVVAGIFRDLAGEAGAQMAKPLDVSPEDIEAAARE